MRNISLAILLLSACLAQVVWADQPEPISVNGPATANRLTFQEMEDGKLLVSVTDMEGKPVMGLTQDDFSIFKGSRTTKIVNVEPLASSKEVSLNLVLVVDNSVSMKDRKAVQPLLDALEAVYQIIRPIDNIAVVVYDDLKTIQINGRDFHAKVLKSQNVDELRAMVKDVMTRHLTGGTYLYDAITVGLDVARKWPQKSHKFMVVFSDGEDINSGINDDAVMKAAKDIPNFGAYTVDYMPSTAMNDFLKTFAGQYHGNVWKAGSATELLPIFKKFSSTLLHRYVVTYRFLNPPVGEVVLEPGQVTIEEVSTIDSAPLLNYIFFDKGRSEIPDRYIQLKGQREAEAFSEKALTTVMEKYWNLLNIIGYRLQQNPEAAITLVGCNSNTGPERGRQDLSRSRAESVRAYLRYVWGIALERMFIENRNLPEMPSSSRVAEGRAENQRVEIRSDDPQILDTVTSEYVEKISAVQQIKVIPKIAAEAGIRDWKITCKCGDDIIGAFSGSGEMAPAYSLPLDKTLLDKMALAGNMTVGLQVSDNESKELVMEEAARLPVKFIQRQQQLAQKQGYRVREKYALILFDYNSAAINSRNKIIVDRIISRMKEVPQAELAIVGHTDNIGKEAYNIKLSEKRAEAVKDQFGQGQELPEPDMMKVSGDGPHNPLYDNNTPEGRALNRTVTIDLEYQQI